MNGVVIVAAGTGSRMNMGINKQFIKLEGKEIIAYTIEKFYIAVSLMQKNFTKFRTNMSLEKFVNIFMAQLNHDYSNIHWHNPLDLMPHMDCVIFTGYIHNKNKLHDKCNVLKIYFYSDTNTMKFIYPHYLEFKPSFYYLIQYAKLSQSIIDPKEK